jgi:hypothetical protein
MTPLERFERARRELGRGRPLPPPPPAFSLPIPELGMVTINPSLNWPPSVFGLTELEEVNALLKGQPLPRPPLPRNVAEAVRRHRLLQDPTPYWDEVVQNLEVRLADARRAREEKRQPPGFH